MDAVIGSIVTAVIAALVTIAVVVLNQRHEFKKLLLARRLEVRDAIADAERRDKKLNEIHEVANGRLDKALTEIDRLRKELRKARAET